MHGETVKFTTVKAWNFKFIFTLFNDALAKSDYISDNNKKELESTWMKRSWLY
jgi:hypothetical protein